jgi:hypothetical protein
MMINRGPQVLKLAPSRRVRRPLCGVLAATIAVDVSQGFVAEKRQQSLGPLPRLFRPSALGRHVPHIAGNHVGDWDRSRITGAARRPVEPLSGDVFGEQLDSPFTIVNAASSAFLVSAIIPDEPHGLVGDGARSVPPLPAEPQARWRGLIPNRVDIDQRPAIVAAKSRIGDWEADTIIGANHKL